MVDVNRLVCMDDIEIVGLGTVFHLLPDICRCVFDHE